jgi:hypothetical protein
MVVVDEKANVVSEVTFAEAVPPERQKPRC